jgi:hypothetical protein
MSEINPEPAFNMADVDWNFIPEAEPLEIPDFSEEPEMEP